MEPQRLSPLLPYRRQSESPVLPVLTKGRRGQEHIGQDAVPRARTRTVHIPRTEQGCACHNGREPGRRHRSGRRYWHIHRRRRDLGIQQTACRSEEHTSELQSLMRISYAVFCLKKKKNKHTTHNTKTKMIKRIVTKINTQNKQL